MSPIVRLQPSFDKSIPNKVNKNVQVKSDHILANVYGGSWTSAIATSGFSSKTDGVYIFATKIDEIGDGLLIVGFTDVQTYSSTKSGTPGDEFTGTSLNCMTGMRDPGSVSYFPKDITKKSAEIISVLTISSNGGKKEVLWVVDGKEGLAQDCTKDFGNGDEIFPCISFRGDGQQVEFIPFDQVKSHSPFIEKFLKESTHHQGKAAAGHNDQLPTSAAFAQLQQELEKERHRANDLEAQLQEKDRQIAQLKQQVLALQSQ